MASERNNALRGIVKVRQKYAAERPICPGSRHGSAGMPTDVLFRAIRQVKGRFASSRNAGMRFAKGHYLPELTLIH